jgi:hypothetical protein
MFIQRIIFVIFIYKIKYDLANVFVHKKEELLLQHYKYVGNYFIDKHSTAKALTWKNNFALMYKIILI